MNYTPARVSQRLNPMSPEQMKRRVRERIAGEIAEKLYQADKASAHAKLTDLAPALRGAYLAQGVHAVFGPMQNARITMIQVEQAHAVAVKSDDAESVRRQAARDIDRYGSPIDRRRADGALDGDGRF